MTNNIKWSKAAGSYKYIDLTSVNRTTHEIGETTLVDKHNAPSRAQKIIKKDDVIFATTRPTLQRFTIINDEYNNQICSTGFCVLRANKSIVLPRWIYYHIAKSDFYDYMETVQKGSAYPAVSDGDVKNYIIPVPSLSEQERIVSTLDQFDALANDARRKQYEYYRDRLLTFREKNVQ